MKKILCLSLLVVGSSNLLAMGGWYDFPENPDKYSKDFYSMPLAKQPSEFDQPTKEVVSNYLKMGGGLGKEFEIPSDNGLLMMFERAANTLNNDGFDETFKNYNEAIYKDIINNTVTVYDFKKDFPSACMATRGVQQYKRKTDLSKKDNEYDRLRADEARKWDVWRLNAYYFHVDYIEKNNLGITWPSHYDANGKKKPEKQFSKEWFETCKSLEHDKYSIFLTTFALVGYLHQMTADAKAMIEKNNE